MITKLEPDQVFVFGSNLLGEHLAGAAAQAHRDFGAIWGIGVGHAGQSYAIPTMNGWDRLEVYVQQFIDFAGYRSDLQFLVTPIGTGIAGFTVEEIAPLFKDAPTNVILPEEFKNL